MTVKRADGEKMEVLSWGPGTKAYRRLQQIPRNTKRPTMKLQLLPLLLLVSCSSLTPQQQAGITTLADLAIGLAATHFGVPTTTTTAITGGVNQLFGVAAQAQANLGQTPTAANIAQGASIPTVGTAIQAALPNTPMTQSTVTLLQSAATSVK